MATIKELVDAHSKVPGDIRVTRLCWGPGRSFVPYYFADLGASLSGWCGMKGGAHSCPADYGDFELYTEPKPKVMRAQYLVEPLSGIPFTSLYWCVDEEEIRSFSPNAGKFTRLEEREFDR